MKKIILLSLTSLLLMFLAGCKEEGRLDKIDKNAPAPAQVSSVTVENISGGAIIRYQIPRDENLLYVKAVYENIAGNVRETKASYYLDSLIVDGFGSTAPRTIELYSVGKNEKESEPITVEVNPLSPPVDETFRTLIMESAFGGVRFIYENPLEATLSFVMMGDTATRGNMELINTFYSKAPKGSFALRGMEPNENTFSLFVRDRWGNSSDTLTMDITPLFEEELPKPYAAHKLPSDKYEAAEGNNAEFGVNCLWDGRWTHAYNGSFSTRHDTELPMLVTVDLKCRAVLSRIVARQRPLDAYQGSNFKRFELWGTDDDVPQDDLFGGGWTLLGNFESFKPSGPGPVTDEDRNYANVQGENFDLEVTDEVTNPNIPVKFIRLRVLETWAGSTVMGQVIISEITLHGQIL